MENRKSNWLSGYLVFYYIAPLIDNYLIHIQENVINGMRIVNCHSHYHLESPVTGNWTSV